VIPFGMSSQYGRDVPGPPKLPNGEWSSEDIVTALEDTEKLDDAQVASRKRHHGLDDDVKLFFILGNALMDASIAAWAWKYKYDYVRPITGIREEYRGRRGGVVAPLRRHPLPERRPARPHPGPRDRLGRLVQGALLHRPLQPRPI
jgi:hypothetical protein